MPLPYPALCKNMNTDDVWLKQKPEPQVECIYFSKAFYNLIFFLPAVIIDENYTRIKMSTGVCLHSSKRFDPKWK